MTSLRQYLIYYKQDADKGP